MNSKNIKRHLKAKMRDWLESVKDENVKKVIEENTIVTGGALVSLLTGEPVNDYDVYFRTREACMCVAQYYIAKWNEEHKDKPVQIDVDEKTGRIKCFVRSKGIADEDEKSTNSLAYNFEQDVDLEEEDRERKEDSEKEEDGKKERYRPRFITSNAITLANKIQIVTRFYGDVQEIHKNFDFAHCTCAWSSWDNVVSLPQKALECIINKELYYVGSKYPLCSIVRTRKYLSRGYHINAGQYVKMAMQLNELDLRDVNVLEEQLTGVDTAYFTSLIIELKKHQTESGEEKVDLTYAMEVINKLF